MKQEDKELLLKDLCARLTYQPKLQIYYEEMSGSGVFDEELWEIDGDGQYCNGGRRLEDIKPYLRSMSSMTDGEKEELLNAVVGEDAIKYFQVLPDGSIDNTDAAHQDLHNFAIHWVSFNATNTLSYLNWLLKNHFDFMGLIPKNLAIEVTKENNPYENGL